MIGVVTVWSAPVMAKLELHDNYIEIDAWVIDQSLPCSESCFLQNFDGDDDVKKDNDNRRNDEADQRQVELDPGGGGHVKEAGVWVHLT